jgi:hypothetical protein
MISPSLGLKTDPSNQQATYSEMSVNFYETTRHHIPADSMPRPVHGPHLNILPVFKLFQHFTLIYIGLIQVGSKEF